MADFGDYKNIPRSPFHYSLQIDEFDQGFSNRNHLEVRIRGRKEGQKIENLEIPLGDIWEIEASWWVGGGGGWGGVGDFQCRPINPVILFYLMDCSMRLHVSSCTNRAGLKQPVTTMWIKPQASQASRKRKQFIHEVVTRCVTRYMGKRNNSDGKTSLKR